MKVEERSAALLIFSWGSYARLDRQFSSLGSPWKNVVWIDPFSGPDRIGAIEGAEKFQRIEAVLAGRNDDIELYKYSLTDLYSMTTETSSLRSLMPGLKVTGTIRVPAVTSEVLISRLPPLDGPLTVVIDCPGQEHTALAFLKASGLLRKVGTLYIRAGVEPFFEDACAAVDLAKSVEEQGLSAGEIFDGSDPDWPVYQFRSDQRTRLVYDLRANLDNVAQSRDALKKATTELQNELEACDGALARVSQENEQKAVELQHLTKERDAGQSKITQLEQTLKTLRKDHEIQQALNTEKITRLSCEAQQLRLDLRRATAIQETLKTEKDILSLSNKGIEKENKELRCLLGFVAQIGA